MPWIYDVDVNGNPTQTWQEPQAPPDASATTQAVGDYVSKLSVSPPPLPVTPPPTAATPTTSDFDFGASGPAVAPATSATATQPSQTPLTPEERARLQSWYGNIPVPADKMNRQEYDRIWLPVKAANDALMAQHEAARQAIQAPKDAAMAALTAQNLAAQQKSQPTTTLPDGRIVPAGSPPPGGIEGGLPGGSETGGQKTGEVSGTFVGQHRSSPTTGEDEIWDGSAWVSSAGPKAKTGGAGAGGIDNTGGMGGMGGGGSASGPPRRPDGSVNLAGWVSWYTANKANDEWDVPDLKDLFVEGQDFRYQPVVDAAGQVIREPGKPVLDANGVPILDADSRPRTEPGKPVMRMELMPGGQAKLTLYKQISDAVFAHNQRLITDRNLPQQGKAPAGFKYAYNSATNRYELESDPGSLRGAEDIETARQFNETLGAGKAKLAEQVREFDAKSEQEKQQFLLSNPFAMYLANYLTQRGAGGGQPPPGPGGPAGGLPSAAPGAFNPQGYGQYMGPEFPILGTQATARMTPSELGQYLSVGELRGLKPSDTMALSAQTAPPARGSVTRRKPSRVVGNRL